MSFSNGVEAQEFSPQAQETLRKSVLAEKTESVHFMSAAIYASSMALTGQDSVWNSVKITSPMNFGIKLGYSYAEEALTLRAELGYRNVKFKGDTSSAITVENTYTPHDISVAYYIIHQTWEKIKLIASVKYQSLYFFQSRAGQNVVEVKSVLEAVPTVGLEGAIWNSASAELSGFAMAGISFPNKDVKSGPSAQFGLRYNRIYSADYKILSQIDFSETRNKTIDNQFTIPSDQVRAEINLMMGLQREF